VSLSYFQPSSLILIEVLFQNLGLSVFIIWGEDQSDDCKVRLEVFMGLNFLNSTSFNGATLSKKSALEIIRMNVTTTRAVIRHRSMLEKY